MTLLEEKKVKEIKKTEYTSLLFKVQSILLFL